MRDLEDEVHRIRCKSKEGEGNHEDGSSIDPRGGVVINRVEVSEEQVAPIDQSSASISNGGA